METYYITGVQLGLILGLTEKHPKDVRELVHKIIQEQQISNKCRTECK